MGKDVEKVIWDSCATDSKMEGKRDVRENVDVRPKVYSDSENGVRTDLRRRTSELF